MSEFFKYSKNLEYLFAEHGEVINYEENQHLVWNKDKCPWVFFLKEGLVKVTFNFSEKDTRLIGYFVPGHIFAQSGSFIGEYDGRLSYTAKTKTKVYRMKHSIFIKLTKKYPEVMNEYLDMTLRNQLLLIDRVVYQGEKGLYLKCVRWLLFMAKYYGKTTKDHVEIIVPMTQETAANFLHTTRESLNVMLRKLEKEEIISTKHKKIEILKLSKLKKIVKSD